MDSLTHFYELFLTFIDGLMYMLSLIREITLFCIFHGLDIICYCNPQVIVIVPFVSP